MADLCVEVRSLSGQGADQQLDVDFILFTCMLSRSCFPTNKVHLACDLQHACSVNSWMTVTVSQSGIPKHPSASQLC